MHNSVIEATELGQLAGNLAACPAGRVTLLEQIAQLHCVKTSDPDRRPISRWPTVSMVLDEVEKLVQTHRRALSAQ